MKELILPDPSEIVHGKPARKVMCNIKDSCTNTRCRHRKPHVPIKHECDTFPCRKGGYYHE